MQKWLVNMILVLCTEMLYGQGFPVAITELMIDPVPAVSLPSEEYIELTNTSSEKINLSKWRLSNGRSTVVFPDSVYLEKAGILIVCKSSVAELFHAYGSVIGLSSFPALSNEGDTILLCDADNVRIHAIVYHADQLAETDGGRSLEMLTLNVACSLQNNWFLSENTAGGSPGAPNIFKEREPVLPAFTLLYAYCINDSSVQLVFDEAVDPVKALLPSSYTTTPLLSIKSAEIIGPLNNEVLLTLNEPIDLQQIYTIETVSLESCLYQPAGGNALIPVRFGWPSEEISGLVINEILFDPPDEGADFIELHNTGKLHINLRDISLANRNSLNEISSIKKIEVGSYTLLPGEYITYSTKRNWLMKKFHVRDSRNIVQLPSLPAWSNESGTVVVLNDKNEIIDELNYLSDWHTELLRNPEGVSLERINPLSPTSDKNNWTSAATHAGYGTPGEVNSQRYNINITDARIWIEPGIFSPNSNVSNQQCFIRYEFKTGGQMIAIKIHDRQGRQIRNLVNNGLCGTSGQFAWDGKNDSHQLLDAGPYFMIADIFSLDGKTKRYRFTVTLAQ